MNILIITHAAGTPDIGPNLRTYYLAKNLVDVGHSVNILGSGFFHKYSLSPIQNKSYTKKVVSGIVYHWLPTYVYKKRNHHQVLNQLDFLIQGLKNKKKWIDLKPDIIIVSSPHPLSIYIGTSIKKRTKAKLIFEIRDLWPEILQDLGNFSWYHPYISLIRKAAKKAYKEADGIVSVKEGDLDYIKSKYLVNGKTHFISNGFDHLNVLDEEYSHPILEGNEFKVVYTGALSNYYSIASLIGAAKLLRKGPQNILFLIVGDGENKAEYELLIKKYELDNVKILGYLPKKNMLSIIKQCDVSFLGLKDTKVNQFGISTNKLFEYMYAKSPVLASYNTEYDVVKKANCGISVQPDSSEEIASAVSQFYNMPEKDRIELGNNGYNYLMNNFTFERITNEYLDFIEKLN